MKKLNRVLALVLSLVIAMSFTVVSNAANKYDPGAIKEYEIGLNGGFDLLPESQGTGETFDEATNEYCQKYSYTSQVPCSLNFQIWKNSDGDKHKNNGTYEIYVAEGNGQYAQISEVQAANLSISAKTVYHIMVVRKYSPAVKETYIGYTAKLNPQVLTKEMTPIVASGNKNICAYYTFTPATDGGYLFNLEPANGCIGDGKNYQVNVYSKVGSSLYEFASFEKGVSKSMLRLYLKANTEYIVEVQGYGEGELGYTFTLDSVPVGPSIALVGAPTLALDNELSCTLYPFANRRAFAWYTFTAPKAGSYEFVVNNKFDANLAGDIQAELKDETFSPTEDDDILYLYENESGVLTHNMREGEVCYIQIAEQYRGALTDVYNVGVKVREHAHVKELFVDGDYVSYGCTCQLDEYIDYAYWFEGLGFANATYTGKAVTPKAKFSLNVVLPDDGSFTPTIPESAYTVTVTSSNKKNVGKAKAKVKFTGAYKSLGTKTASFKIVPKGTSLSKVTAAKSGFTAKWKKQATQTGGYELRYSANSSMSGAKTVAVKSNKTISKKISKLKSNTRYYVQVRTYKNVSGKKYASAWSKQLAVTTK